VVVLVDITQEFQVEMDLLVVQAVVQTLNREKQVVHLAQ
jgi:hypothetical protein